MFSIYKLIATALGAGYLPKAPGTWGSVLAVIICIVLHHFLLLSNSLLITLTIIFTIIGTWATYKLEPMWGEDPSRVVIDEVIGIWITLLFLPYSMTTFVLALILFRIFDIWKPLFIRKLEKIPYGIGVMADDILAGVYANLVLQVIYYTQPSWLS